MTRDDKLAIGMGVAAVIALLFWRRGKPATPPFQGGGGGFGGGGGSGTW